MHTLKTLCASLFLASLSSLAMAADNPLGVHVLNLNDDCLPLHCAATGAHFMAPGYPHPAPRRPD